VQRVKIGKLGTASTDYGIIVKDSAGAVVLDVTGLGAYAIAPYVSGNYIQAFADSERTNSGTTPTIRKEIYLLRKGTVNVSFDLHTDTIGATSYAQVYRNGAAVGTLQSTTSLSYVTFTEAISGWSRGDACQLYAYSSANTVSAYVRNFRIRIDNPTVEYVTLN
jgi:hypothetical protein